MVKGNCTRALVALALGSAMLLASGCQLVMFEGEYTKARLKKFPTSSSRGAPKNNLVEMTSRRDGGWGWSTTEALYYDDFRAEGRLSIANPKRFDDTLGSEACYLSGRYAPGGGFSLFATICARFVLNGLWVETRDQGTLIDEVWVPGRRDVWVAIEGDEFAEERHFEYSTDGVDWNLTGSVSYQPKLGYNLALGSNFMTRKASIGYDNYEVPFRDRSPFAVSDIDIAIEEIYDAIIEANHACNDADEGGSNLSAAGVHLNTSAMYSFNAMNRLSLHVDNDRSIKQAYRALFALTKRFQKVNALVSQGKDKPVLARTRGIINSYVRALRAIYRYQAMYGPT